eukprot:9753860-Karenia_brevis.AAC.1
MCKISKRTAVIATRKHLVQHTCHLCKKGLKAKIPRVVMDLGLDYTGGNRKATGTLRKGVAQAR